MTGYSPGCLFGLLSLACGVIRTVVWPICFGFALTGFQTLSLSCLIKPICTAFSVSSEFLFLVGHKQSQDVPNN